LADRIGCATSLLHKWEQHKRVPSMFMLICWTQALGMEVLIRDKQETTQEQVRHLPEH